MKKIHLNNSTYATVDDEDFERIRIYPWRLLNTGKSRCYCGFNLKVAPRKYQRQWLHHMVAGNPPHGKRVFFKDRNSLNCSKSNIEFLSPSQFGHITHNKGDREYIGVVLEYLARVKVNKKVRVIGVYKTAEEAARAYDEEIKKIYGSLADVNFK